MNFTLKSVAKSLANYLAPAMPGVTWYEDPNQQGTEAPCAFLQQREGKTRLKAPGRWLRRIKLDITYLEDYNLPNMQQLYLRAAEAIDGMMETFPYSDGDEKETALLRTYEREWHIDLDGMHYLFELEVWVDKPEEFIPMQTMDYNEEVRDGKEEIQP